MKTVILNRCFQVAILMMLLPLFSCSSSVNKQSKEMKKSQEELMKGTMAMMLNFLLIRILKLLN